MKEKMEKIKLTCASCRGTGQDWNQRGSTNQIILDDCLLCDGHGKVPVLIIDKRKNSKGKKKHLPDMW